jgi:hypothetical protein
MSVFLKRLRLFSQSTASSIINAITGTGTTNKLSKFTAAGTIGDSQLFDNGTNVGIGTATPSAKLEIFNSGPASDLLIQSIATIPFVVGNFNAFSVSNAGRIVSGYLDSNLASTVGHSFYASQGATNILSLKTQNGSQNIFEVNTDGSFQIGHLASTVTSFAHNGLNKFTFTGDISQSVGINQINPTATFHAKGIDATSSNYALKVDNSAGTPLLYVRNDGVVIANNLPTSATGLPVGAIWRNGNVLNII